MINRCKVVFLDRDGTINKDKNYIYKKEEFEFIDGSIDALKLLIQHDFNLIIITNQSGIARGFYTEDDYNKLNDWMLSELKSNNINILDTYYCPHFPNGLIKKYALTCNCRKPKTELFKKAIKKYSVDEKHSWAIGDKSRDKYFAIIGIDQDSVLVGSVLINTEINPKMFMKIATLQHRILPDDYDFLGGKERYIDCSSLFEIKYDRALYDADYIGILKEDDLSEIIRLTLTSPFIKKGKLKKYMNVE